ncbi:MAG: carboxypeptidase regulatory-like domain-containing protein [SAR202 cluster bacterium]|nr:carboxypeptidase regulatory-like domain-containing protein [SAR202 cluster bacterium]
MLIGYVSDERYLALPDAQVEIEGAHLAIEVRSRASGAVHADLSPGTYTVTLAKAGHGSKRVVATLGDGRIHHFRLLPDTLLGYAWPRAVRAGERSEYRVHSPEAYKMELWRYGREKRLVRPISWLDEHGPRATVQVTPDGDYTRTGVRWNEIGYRAAASNQWVTAPDHSGLYYFHAKGASGAFFSFPWIVAPARPSASIAVVLSDFNWTAYNNFGGRSNYIHPEGLPPTPTIHARGELRRYNDPEFSAYEVEEYPPLSMDRPEPINFSPEHERPTDPIEGRAANHVAPAEWRLLAWMEREGLAYDVYSESQLHAGQLDLAAYRLLVLGPHPEYWSDRMYRQVKAWVHDRGGRLAYLGGNGINCAIEILNESTIRVLNGDARAMRQGGFESRFHYRVEPEAALLGVAYTEAGVMTAAPYEVRDATHWVFEGTALADGDRFGQRSQHMRIPGGASGHETDKITASSPRNIQLLAKGLNPDDGGAEMVTYETPSGSAVFSTGSICWVSSLLVDENVSRITANVLRRFSR